MFYHNNSDQNHKEDELVPEQYLTPFTPVFISLRGRKLHLCRQKIILSGHLASPRINQAEGEEQGVWWAVYSITHIYFVCGS